MSAATSHGDDLVDVVADLEDRIETLVRWARAVRDLGGCGHAVSPDGLIVIGDALLDDARAAKAGWQQCLDAVRDLRDRRPSSAAPAHALRLEERPRLWSRPIWGASSDDAR